MVKLVTDEYIEKKYGITNKDYNCARGPNIDTKLVSDETFIDIIGTGEVSATTILDTLNRTCNMYKRVNYNYVHRRLLQLYNRKQIDRTDYGQNGVLWKNNTNYKPKPTGFKAFMIKHAPKCKKLIMR